MVNRTLWRTGSSTRHTHIPGTDGAYTLPTTSLIVYVIPSRTLPIHCVPKSFKQGECVM